MPHTDRKFRAAVSNLNQSEKENIMWTKPEAIEMRFGFEVTMYVCNR
jgi:pyrroloquinoline quinone biosynthesis protein A